MKRRRCAAVAIACLMAGSSFGAGFQLYTEGSAEALGQAGAISGRDDLTSLAWYNPAALAGSERPAIMAGATFASIKTDFSSSVLQDESMSDDWRTIPHLYYVQPISETWTGMLSINTPYGLITEWPDNWDGNVLAIYSDLATIYITPSVAWKPIETLAIGAGVNVVNAEAELSRFDPAPPIPPAGKAVVEGDDINYGGTVSAHYQPFEDWGFGIRYQSHVKLEITGTSRIPAISLPASADIELPSSVNLGVANKTFENLKLGLDLVWTEWSTYDRLSITTPGGTTTVPKNWEDVISIRIGGEYALGESWALRAGYVWDESPVPDTTRAPELPGSDRQMVMAGVGWKTGGLGIDFAYSYLWADKAKLGTDFAPARTGEFDTTTHLVALSVGYAF